MHDKDIEVEEAHLLCAAAKEAAEQQKTTIESIQQPTSSFLQDESLTVENKKLKEIIGMLTAQMANNQTITHSETTSPSVIQTRRSR